MHSFTRPNSFLNLTPTAVFPNSSRSDNDFPIGEIQIDWDRLSRKREMVLKIVDSMPVYLLKPEILGLLDAEKDPTRRLMLDLLWCTGARVSELLALTRESFLHDGYDYGVFLKTLKAHPGRPTKAAQTRSPKRFITLYDSALIDRIQCYLTAGHFRANERIFKMCRQTVNRHIHSLVERVGGAPFSIHAHTFRHSFAVHLLLHARPLKLVSQLLGHSSIESTEIYTNVLTSDWGHLLKGVAFH